MEFQKLGKSDLQTSRIGLGCWTIGNRLKKTVSEKEAIRTIHAALDSGINFFDTADHYGQGRSERILAKALGNQRKQVIISSKVGVRYENKKFCIDLSTDNIKKAIDDSLMRLQTDYLDLYQPHWPDANMPLGEMFEALNCIVKKGKVRYIGASNFDTNQLLASTRFTKIVSLQSPLNLLKRDYEVAVIPFCYKQNIGVITHSPLANGLLADTNHSNLHPCDETLSNDPLFRNGVFQRHLALVSMLKKFAQEHHKSISQLAIAWILSHPTVTSTFCGACSASQVRENAGAVGWQLSQTELSEIDTILSTTT